MYAAQVAGVKIEANLAPKEGWSKDLSTLYALVEAHPILSSAIFLALLVVLVLIPGGVGPAWVRYRGAKSVVEQNREADVNKLIDMLHARHVRPQSKGTPPRRAKKGGKR